MKARILKNMVASGVELKTGDIVDVSGWRNALALNRSRYILILEEEAKPVKAKAPEKPVVEEVAPEKPKTTKKSPTKTEE